MSSTNNSSSSRRRGLLSDTRSSGSKPGKRHRSTAATSEHHDGGPADLPDYEPPAFPLDQRARAALTELASANRDSAKYKAQLAGSLKELNESVRDINDAYTERRTRLRNHQARRRGGGAAAGGAGSTQQQQQQQQDDEVEEDNAAAGGGEGGGGASATSGGQEKRGPERAEEKAVMMLKDEVPQLSEQIEAAVREVIDMQVLLEDGQAALRDAARQAEAESAQVAARQRERAAARQARLAAREAARAQRGDGGVDDDDDDEEDMEEEEGAGDGEEEDVDMQDEITGPLLMLEEAKHRLASEYAAKSMYARYGVHNEYIAFKKLWHDAVHGAEGKPLPDASRWFAEDGRGQNRQQEHDGHEHGNDDAGDDDDDDDDLVIDQEHVSLHCPLTLQIMKEPYTSHKCRHTFDKTSIQQFLGKTSKQCPQTGCSEMVAFKDFYFDQIMLRRIKRAEAASNNDTMMDDDDDDEAGYDEEPTMASVKMTQERAVKTERGAAGSSRRGRRGEDVEDEDE